MKTIKDINFLPDYLKSNQTKFKKKLSTFILILISIIVVLGILAAPKLVYVYYEKQSQKIENELSKYDEISKKMSEHSILLKEGKNKKEILDSAEKNQIMITELIADIEYATPYNVKLLNYSINETSLMVSFDISSPLDIISIIDNFEKLDRFSKISINTFPIVDKTETISVRFDFK